MPHPKKKPATKSPRRTARVPMLPPSYRRADLRREDPYDPMSPMPRPTKARPTSTKPLPYMPLRKKIFPKLRRTIPGRHYSTPRSVPSTPGRTAFTNGVNGKRKRTY